MRFAFLLPLALLAGCEAKTSRETDTPPVPDKITAACEPVIFEDSPLTHCKADPKHHRISMVVAPAVDEQAPYRSFAAYAAARPTVAAPVAFAMNGGMFDETGQPIGYYVEHGERLKRLNRAKGPGNFHLKLNGVFFGSADGVWQVLDTDAFADQITKRPDFATQSGPMLVIDGEIHPDFAPDGDSLKIRNAVGVDRAGQAHFVISQAPISFGKLARYFRDILNTPQALFLDGSVSQLWDPVHNRMDSGLPLGPLIVVENRATAAP